jgi:small subunit ribosomal protein S17
MTKSITGKVVSDKGDKTIVIAVVSKVRHPIYKKNYSQTKRFVAHDEKNEAKVGDIVTVVETRPLSATKRFRMAQVVETAAIDASNTVEAITAEEPVEEEKQ